MSNILFVGPYRQNDGWGNAAKEYVRALRTTPHNVTTKPIYMNNETNYGEFHEFDDLESSHYEYDVIIQNCLPNMFRYYGDVKNIGLSYFESTIKGTSWVEPINMMDEMIVSSRFEVLQLIESGVVTPVVSIPIPTDLSKYDKNHHYANLTTEHKGECVFYFIGEFITRKNLDALIIAFHTEFGRDEQVRLAIKTSLGGSDEQDTFNILNDHINQLKKVMALYPNLSDYKREIVITKHLTDEELLGLHNDCDCLVMPSSGEAFCIPVRDAMAYDNPCIVNQNTGSFSAMKMANSAGGLYPVESRREPCVAADRPLPHLYTPRDSWYRVNIDDLMTMMRHVYETRDLYTNNDLSIMSHEKVGLMMEQVL